MPRLKEIINVNANIKTPALTVFLDWRVARDRDLAKTVLNTLEYATLADITERTEIYYDPDYANSVVEEDREWLNYFFEIPDEVRLCLLVQCAACVYVCTALISSSRAHLAAHAHVRRSVGRAWRAANECDRCLAASRSFNPSWPKSARG